jgi:hypothetical protein
MRTSTQTSRSHAILLLPAFMLLVGTALSIALIGATSSRGIAVPRPLTTARLNLTVLAPAPNGGPAYSPANFTLPAYARVTVTIVNQDLGDTPLPAGSPFSAVKGTVGNTAAVDGVPYSALGREQVAHTFTILPLGLNVPIPGDAPAGHQGVTVTFTFVTGKPGTYMWQCFDPCGGGVTGWQAPMGKMGYMMGNLTVQ